MDAHGVDGKIFGLKKLYTMYLLLEDGTQMRGDSFGAQCDASGEVVFNTGMVGYPEGFTDPSYRGQILVLTYPLVGNYGVPAGNLNELKNPFESSRIQISGLVVNEYSKNYSHFACTLSLTEWLKQSHIPAISGVDTRALTQKLRRKGVMLGTLAHTISKPPASFDNPNKRNLVAEVSTSEAIFYSPHSKSPHKTVLLYDCGVKLNIIRSLLARNTAVLRVPWNFDFIKATRKFDGIIVSNGPGDPEKADQTIHVIKKAMQSSIPILGICLGNQILALAAGAKTFKLPYGHRSQNQPCMEMQTQKAYITSQNHGFAVDPHTLQNGFEIWFQNLNDDSVEGIRHREKPWMAVQFHPESNPGPTDTSWIFDFFLKHL
ncbi:MAG: Carbamoyl-phosphate synthase small chain [Parcubacteria group bacterium GW2011_GWA2_44_12]|nr:MAG: Carbamoyl-phosphate synthase small chain [Parcubacteria group bacterium GW2011_GWA2_44_12]